MFDTTKPTKIVAPVVHAPTAEEVEALTMGVFTIKDGAMTATDPAVTSWMETMRGVAT